MTKSRWFAIALLSLAACGGSSNTAPDAGSPDGGPDAGSDAGPADGGVATGGACTQTSQCASGNYCSGIGCGTAGTCAANPASCPPDVSAVCGCDGVDYTNSCQASLAGARVFATGNCTPPTSQCTMLYSQIGSVVDAGQTCSANSDCVIDRTPCGVGPCWAALNNSNDTQLQPLVASYSSDLCGPAGTCASCTILPSSAVCDAGHCESK